MRGLVGLSGLSGPSGRIGLSGQRTLRRRTLLCAVAASLLAGCSSVGVGLTIPIGPVGVTIGGSVPLPKPSEPAASAPSQ